MTRYLVGAAILALVGYGAIEAWPLIAGPALAIDSPVENGTFPDGTVRVSGSVARASGLRVNGQTILYDQQGFFSALFAFPAGGSILTFEATDRFGRTVTASRTVFVPIPEQPAAN